MCISEPTYGLFTLRETDEDISDLESSTTGSTDSRRNSSSSVPSLSTSPYPSSVDPFDSFTPNSECDDLFSFDPDWRHQDADGKYSRDWLSTRRTPTRATSFALACSIDLQNSPCSTRPSPRTPTGSLAPPRVSASPAAGLPLTPPSSYSMPTLLPALPIYSDREWAARTEIPSPPTLNPSSPLEERSGAMGVNLVSALRDLLTSCGECDDEADMFADAEDDDGIDPSIQFADADSRETSPVCSPVHRRSWVRPATPERPPRKTRLVCPPMPCPSSSNQKRQPKCPRLLLGDHSFLRSLSQGPEREDFCTITSSTSLDSMQSLRSNRSSCTSLSSIASNGSSCSSISMSSMGKPNSGSVGRSNPPSKALAVPRAASRVSSRRLLPSRVSLPTYWTSPGNGYKD